MDEGCLPILAIFAIIGLFVFVAKTSGPPNDIPYQEGMYVSYKLTGDKILVTHLRRTDFKGIMAVEPFAEVYYDYELVEPWVEPETEQEVIEEKNEFTIFGDRVWDPEQQRYVEQ
jgi:hypothetical protein